MAIDEVDSFLRQFEFAISDLTRKYDGKQSSRLFASAVWMIEHLESKVKNNLILLKKELDLLKNTSQNATVQNNAAISMQHIAEIEQNIDALLLPYKNVQELAQINLSWGKNLPIMNEKLKSLRHRIDIIKNTVSGREKTRIQDEDWYNNL